MAKKQQRTISEVSLKDPKQVIDLPRLGMVINAENLTVDRYWKLVTLSKDFEKYFNVKYNPKENELETKK